MPPQCRDSGSSTTMTIRKCQKPAETVILSFIIESVAGQPPLIGISKEVEKDWKGCGEKQRNLVQSSRKLSKATPEKLQSGKKEKAGIKPRTVSEIGRVRVRFRELEKEELEKKKDDVYSVNYVPKRYSRHSAEYGTPKPGTLTEMRAKKASKHIAKEMLYLCEMIREYGVRSNDGRVTITFGKLFTVYERISDKVVGMLLRARKHRMVDFEGEMLFQGRDDVVLITLLLSDTEIQYGIDAIKDKV